MDFFGLNQLSNPSMDVQGWWDSVEQKRLHFLYFGLLVFGLGSFLFLLFCPTQVSRFSTAQRMIEESEKTQTKALTVAALDRVIARFNVSLQGESSSPFFNGDSLSFPASLQESFHEFISEIFESRSPNVIEEEFEAEAAGHFYTGSGYVNSEAVIDVISSRRRVERALWEELLDIAYKAKTRDILYLDFTASDYSRVIQRYLCAFLLAFGGVLLVVPTVITSVEILFI
ncbi:hypothetical protein LHP98_08885 [Rhodobacter sp. Har01]|uniref:hypothetical protein n=1 Tax=Rhodobacter sp. Har01 TaxID=2883999 RepID=UPI001D094E0F|nr:hypothetical protein [Rhodobacter sp. Har01]MCB6178243.1 hypothetical protein [Rhodobacter sp. Har01]